MKYLLSLVSLVFAAVIFQSVVAADTTTANPLASKSQRWVCLSQTYCEANPGKCSTGTDPHQVLLQADATKPLATSDTFLVECLETPQGQKCTTGDAALDTQVYGNTSTLQYLQTNYQYKHPMLVYQNGKAQAPNPIKSDGSGNFSPVIWGSDNHPGTRHKFLGLNYFTQTDNVQSGDQSTQKLATFEFETISNNKNCVTIGWDPYGRVFDSQTLEPIMGARVELQKLRDDGTYTFYDPSEKTGGNIINPQITKEDGVFNFVVPDGTYQIAVTHPSYTFPSKPESISTDITSQYSKVYSDIYPAQTTMQIVQKGVIQHRDIPMDSKGMPVAAPIKVMEYSYELSKLTNEALVNGRVSQPFAKVNVYSVKVVGTVKTQGKLLKTVTSDRDGVFNVAVDLSKMPKDEQFGQVEAVKNPMKLFKTGASTGQSPFSKLLSLLHIDVQAQTNGTTATIDLNPIPNYLEGVAYNSAGAVVPNATVGVYLQSASKPYYETKADAKGVFKITSEHLPFMPYSLKYTSATGGVSVTVTTAQFEAQNQAYFAQNNVNPDSFKNEKGETAADVAQKTNAAGNNANGGAQNGGSANGMNGSNGTSNGQNAGNTQTAGATQSNLTLIILLVLLLIGVAGGLVAAFLMKKKEPHPYL